MRLLDICSEMYISWWRSHAVCVSRMVTPSVQVGVVFEAGLGYQRGILELGSSQQQCSVLISV